MPVAIAAAWMLAARGTTGSLGSRDSPSSSLGEGTTVTAYLPVAATVG